MKYYSEKTNKVYNTVDELTKAEFQLKEEENRQKILKEREEAKKKELAEARKTRAAEVETAFKTMVDAQKAYKKVLQDFIDDYGSYHYTTTTADNIPSLFDIFNPVFKTLF